MFPDIITLAIPVFIILIALELLVLWQRRAEFGDFDWVDGLASIAMGLGNRAVAILGAGTLMAAAYTYFHQFRLIDGMPITWWTIAVCFVADDFAYYWFHRVAHERRWFWASHVVHHSSQRYNLTTALRQTWTGKLTFSFVFSMPLVVIGFPPAMVLFVGSLNLLYQFWIHTETIKRLGPLEWVLNTPSHHRVHHATNPDYLDANYAGTLIIWDRMFGTFVPERMDEQPRYGIVRNLQTHNPLVIATHEWVSLFRDVTRANSLGEVWRYVMGPPGWRADGTGLTSAAIKAQAAATTAAVDPRLSPQRNDDAAKPPH
ncbi:MAG: sterol desaturase family protein [Pseudomonadota bacterium]